MATAPTLDDIRFDRRLRTSSSEGYYVVAGQTRIAVADLHFSTTTVHCTLILEQELDRPALARLIDQIDEDLVLSADIPRDNFIVTVYTGKEVGLFSDDYHADEDQVTIALDDDADDDDDIEIEE